MTALTQHHISTALAIFAAVWVLTMDGGLLAQLGF